MAPFVEQKRSEIDLLCRRFGVRRLELFGSAARSEASSESDVDFLVELDPSGEQGYADRYFGLLEALEELFSRKVDLLETPAITNPYFLRGISSSRTLLYAA